MNVWRCPDRTTALVDGDALPRQHLDSAFASPDDARATAPFRPNRTEDSITQCVDELIDHRQVVLPDDVDTDAPDRIDRVPCNLEQTRLVLLT